MGSFDTSELGFFKQFKHASGLDPYISSTSEYDRAVKVIKGADSGRRGYIDDDDKSHLESALEQAGFQNPPSVLRFFDIAHDGREDGKFGALRFSPSSAFFHVLEYLRKEDKIYESAVTEYTTWMDYKFELDFYLDNKKCLEDEAQEKDESGASTKQGSNSYEYGTFLFAYKNTLPPPPSPCTMVYSYKKEGLIPPKERPVPPSKTAPEPPFEPDHFWLYDSMALFFDT